MSGQLTQFGANRAVQAGVGQDVAAAAAMYLALATALPAGPDTATLAGFNAYEITTTGYGREEVGWSTPGGDPSEIENDAEIEFGPFTADPPPVQYLFLTDTSIGTSGNVLAYWEADAEQNADTGDSIRIAAGDLTISVD
jgi:hypothetical protein